MVSKLFTTFVAKIKSPQNPDHDHIQICDYRTTSPWLCQMSQGQVNDIKNNAQFLGFKNDRGVIPLCYDFPCKFIKIKWELRRCWLKKLYSSLFSLARPLSKNDTGGQNGPCFCFPQTVICYLLSVPQKNHFWKLSTVNCNAWCWCHWPVPVTFLICLLQWLFL